MSLLLCALIAVSVSWYILRPFFEPDTAPLSRDLGRAVLLEQKERSVNMLRDLELDFSTGKLSREEYSEMKQQLSQELAGILSELDRKPA